MIDDAALLDRQTAYVETLRRLYRGERTAGLVACLAGVVLMVLARYRWAGEPLALWGGVAVIAAGWRLLAYATFRRRLWARAHPFNSNG